MTARDRRALFLGAAVILGVVLLVRALPWAARSLVRLRARVTQQSQIASSARALLAATPFMRDSLGRVLNDIVALAPKLVDGRSAAEAQASLSALVSLAANRHDLKVVRLDPLPDSSAGVFSRANVHAEMEGDIVGLTGFLKAIETATPLLSIGALAVAAPDPRANPNTPEALHLELDLSGYYLPRGEQ
jgi:hypothetical protein